MLSGILLWWMSFVLIRTRVQFENSISMAWLVFMLELKHSSPGLGRAPKTTDHEVFVILPLPNQ